MSLFDFLLKFKVGKNYLQFPILEIRSNLHFLKLEVYSWKTLTLEILHFSSLTILEASRGLQLHIYYPDLTPIPFASLFIMILLHLLYVSLSTYFFISLSKWSFATI